MRPFSRLDTPTRRTFEKADVTALEPTRSRLVDSNKKKPNTFKFQLELDLERTDTFQRVLMNSLVLRG